MLLVQAPAAKADPVGPSSILIDCSPTTLAPPLTPDLPFSVTLTGGSPTAVFPTGASIPATGLGAVITLPGPVVGGLKQQMAGLTAVGLGGGFVTVDATNATPASQASTTAGDITAAAQPVTNYNPTGGPGGTPTADPISLVVPGPISIGSFTSNGTNGGTSTLTAGSTGSGFILTLVNGLVPSIGAGTLNNATGGPGGGGDCTVDPLNAGTTAFASTNLVDPAPTANNQNANLGTGGTSNIVLSAVDTDATPTNHFQLVPGSISDPRLTVNITNAATGATTLSDAGGPPAIVTFQFTACDDDPVNTNCDATPATVTVNIGTPPVQQPINQLVNAGQLVLSCSAPGTPGYPALTCPVINMPPITLNGLQQTTTAPMNTIYVSDNRGDLTLPWSLSAYMVPTISVPGCTSADFCNSEVGANLALANNHIAATNLTLTPTALTGCAAHVGNLNPNATVGAGGTLDTPRSLCSAVGPNAGGTFDVAGQFSLNIPSSVAAGLYKGTVEYLVV